MGAGKAENVPIPTVKRLSLYLRQLEMFQGLDRRTISSKDLGRPLDLSGAQVRKDLACFGQFGYPGVGYHVEELIVQVRQILGTDRQVNVVLVGLGHLGQALIAYRGFRKKGFEVVAVFDHDPAKIGRVQEVDPHKCLTTHPLHQMSAIVKKHSVRLGILAVPTLAAQSVADEMVAAGIRGILNFAPLSLQVGPGVSVSSVDLAVHLEQLSFQLNTLAG